MGGGTVLATKASCDTGGGVKTEAVAQDKKRHGLRRQKAQQQNTSTAFYRWTRFTVAILKWLIKGLKGMVGRGVSGGGGGAAGNAWEGRLFPFGMSLRTRAFFVLVLAAQRAFFLHIF